MDHFRKVPGLVKDTVVNDITLQRTVRYGAKAIRAAPSVASQYLQERVPIIHCQQSRTTLCRGEALINLKGYPSTIHDGY
jgi:hypothetical protein